MGPVNGGERLKAQHLSVSGLPKLAVEHKGVRPVHVGRHQLTLARRIVAAGHGRVVGAGPTP